MESTLKIIGVDVETSSFGYDLTIENFVKRGLWPLLLEDLLISQLSPLEERALHHMCQNIIMVRIENASFGYDLTSENKCLMGSPLLRRPSDF